MGEGKWWVRAAGLVRAAGWVGVAGGMMVAGRMMVAGLVRVEEQVGTLYEWQWVWGQVGKVAGLMKMESGSVWQGFRGWNAAGS